MKIYIRSANQNNLPASTQVNRVGKFLYNHLDGAYKYTKSSNMYDVYVTLLYQLKPEYGGGVNEVEEMTININICTDNVRNCTIRMFLN